MRTSIPGLKADFAFLEDLPSWMELVRLVSCNFPGLETKEAIEEYKQTVIRNINRNSAICVKDNTKVVGILLFSAKNNMLSCMAVHPDYRKKGLATQMIKLMLKNLDADRDIIVTTFREDDEKGTAPRALYKKLGFVEAELDYEFNYPVQKYILYRSGNRD